MKKIIKTLFSLLLIFSISAVGVYAADSISVGEIAKKSKEVTVNFDVVNLQKNDDVTILVFKKTEEKPDPDISNIVYINQLNTEESKITFTLPQNATDGTYEVRMGGTNIKKSSSGFFQLSTYIPGDINGDGIVNTKDITTLRRYNSGGYSDLNVVEEALDVNKDGIVNTKDITTLRRYNSGGYDIEIK